MKQNIGKADKYIRIVLGVIVIAIGIYYQSWWGLLGILPIFTASLNWCPAYLPFKFSTLKSKINNE